MRVTIYHNPKCTKSRETLALLQEKGIEPVVVEYLKTPPSVDDLLRFSGLLGLSLREMMRPKEAAEAGLDDPALDGPALAESMHGAPIVIQRPIVVVEDDRGMRARIGRPPESVLEIL